VTACRAHLSAALLWWLGFVAPTAASESFPLVLEHLTTADGLPQGTVWATLQDSQGFVWLATEDGLVRYDGHELVRYARLPTTPGGLSGNFIFQMIEDAQRDLWIAVKDGGVAHWHRDTNSFTVIRHSDADPRSLASDAVRALVLDARGRVWIGTSDAGIDILEPATGRIEHLRHAADNPDSLVSDQILTLTFDRSGTLWAGTEQGLDGGPASRRRRFSGFPPLRFGRPTSRRGGASRDSLRCASVAAATAGIHTYPAREGQSRLSERQRGLTGHRGSRRLSVGGHVRWRAQSPGPERPGRGELPSQPA